jgi:hypothetical protein
VEQSRLAAQPVAIRVDVGCETDSLARSKALSEASSSSESIWGESEGHEGSEK